MADLAKLPEVTRRPRVAGATTGQELARLRQSVRLVDDGLGAQMVTDPVTGEVIPQEQYAARQSLRQQFGG